MQKSVLKELITRGFYINYRPHIDPIKYAMPLGSTRDNWNTNPGGKDWRGKFNLLNPTDPAIGYTERVVLPSLDILANAIREAGVPVRPVRFDIGAELMDSMLNYPTNLQNLLVTVRNALTNQYSDVASNIVLSHNFCHHIEYLLRLPGHSNYIARIVPSETIDPENQYLDRPGVSTATKIAIGKYIAGLDEMSISQYLPLDIFNAGGNATNTTPAQVKQALQKFEDDFINHVLLGELQIPANKLPVLHIGEYGMGIRGLVAPNAWDAAGWTAAGKGGLLLSDDVQRQHAAIAMQGIIQYVNSSQTRYRSFLIWMGGKPYDILDINYYSDWYNPVAANAVESYWNEYTQIPPVSDNLVSVVPVVPAVTNITRLVGGNIQISGTGQDGATYRVLVSANITQPRTNWTEIHSGTLTGGQFQFTDTNATNQNRYYLIVMP